MFRLSKTSLNMNSLLFFMFISFRSISQHNDILTTAEFKIRFLEIIPMTKTNDFDYERIKLINTFNFYYRFFPEDLRMEFNYHVNLFQKKLWKEIKTKYDFEISTGLGYYSEVLKINYGGSSLSENSYILEEYFDYMNIIKKMHEKGLD